MSADRRPDRQNALRRHLAGAGLDGLLVTHLPNIRYLTGFTGSSALLLVAEDRTLLITDSRYTLQGPLECAGASEVVIEPVNLWDGLRRAFRGGAHSSGSRDWALGFEADRLTVSGTDRMRAAFGGRLEPTKHVVEDLRVAKDPTEVEAIRAAGALAVDALLAVLPSIRVGKAERWIAAQLELALRERGSEWHPFQTIVASGPRSALPHATSSERVLEKGDLVLLDFGAIVDGYCADLTRTGVVGAPPDTRQREVYQAVDQAKAAGFGALGPGVAGREVDARARGVLESLGLGRAFTHSLGHGLGLEVHEDPRLARSSEATVPAGAVVTIEPGAYLEGWGGVRLEDDAVVTPAGAEYLSGPSSELLIL